MGTYTTSFLYTEEDDAFDRRYPLKVERLSPRHWTPVQVARTAAKLLVQHPGTRVLDVGCGPGKFCAVGALVTEGIFTGIEQRPKLARIARDMIRDHGIEHVTIVEGNIADVSFAAHDAFYIYNPFQENILPSMKIDGTVDISAELYQRYTGHLQEQLSGMPLGTRVVTFHGVCEEIPPQYDCDEELFAGLLKLWVKVRPLS
ncbi:MAG TPA: methyltransferase domain-containing protein [Prosthecobacter sp.]|nr:methyltransferase domain-containing protein [Prosthecobacter sp.]